MKSQVTCCRVDDGLSGRATVTTVIVVTMISVGGTARAQSPRSPGVQADVAVGVAYDDNVFWRPLATPDLIQRVTPSIEMHHETPRLTLSNRYRFDAERYTDHPELTTPFARGDAAIEAAIRSSTRTKLALRAGYQRTQTASELNVTTGLATGRLLGSRGEFSSELTRTAGANGSVIVGYEFGADAVEEGIDNQSHSARLRFTRGVGTRDEVQVAYLGERWAFQPGEPILSHVGSVGWSRRITPLTKLTLEGGPRLTAGLVQPEVKASLSRRVEERTEVALTYSHTRTVAVGLPELIETDSMQASVAYRQPGKWDVVFGGGSFRNVLREGEVLAYQLSGEIARALSGPLWLAATFDASLNDHKVGGIAAFDQRVRRDVVALSLRVSPRSPR